ncbi:MAG: hypothetical protein ACI4PW_04525 [Alphaproteobacteria bacterium]
MTEIFSPKDRKNHEAMMKRVRSTQARHYAFYPSFSFPTVQSMQDMLSAAKENGVWNINFSGCALGARKTQWLAGSLGLLPGLKTLTLDTNAIGRSGTEALFQKLPATRILHLSLANNGIGAAAFPVLLKNIPASRLLSLNLSRNSLNDRFITDLADLLPRTNLRELSLAGVGMTGTSSGRLMDAAAAAKMRVLDISGNRIQGSSMTELIGKLPPTSLKTLRLEHTGMTEKDAFLLLKTLPDTSITDIAFTVSGRPSDRFLETLTSFMKDPACRLENAKIDMFGLSDYEKSQIKEAQDEMRSNASHRNYYKNKILMNSHRETADVGMPLRDAVDEGLLPQVMAARAKEGKMLEVGECLTPQPITGAPFVVYAAKAEQLSLLFRADNWQNARDMQTVWNAVPNEHRWQMDGRKGRPSFQKEKNLVLERTVKAALSTRIGGRK